jgi:hypothetical protein
VAALLDLSADGRAHRVDAALAVAPTERRGAMMRGLAWLCKLDLIRISASESAATDR